ncbi:hypothetical protein ACFL1L_02655 [Thermoplasmatota archaeon]
MMKISKITKSDEAVVGIIVAVLLIGLMLIVVSILQTVFIPNWMKQVEAEHMDEVSEQFAQLKFAIDLQTVLNVSNLPISTPVTIGNKGFPILNSGQSFGDLTINEDATIFTIDNTSTPLIELGTIQYSSNNFYFLDQTYTYESGGIIITQDEGSIMTIKPSITMELDESNDLLINLTLINISITGNKYSASGFGTYPIRVEYNGIQISENISEFVTYINVSSSYPDAWYLFFRSPLNNIIENLGFSLTEDILDIVSDTVVLNLDELRAELVFSDIYVKYSTVKINAQIAPGWVE